MIDFPASQVPPKPPLMLSWPAEPGQLQCSQAALAPARCSPEAVLEDKVSSPGSCWASQDMLTVICKVISAKLTRALPVSVCCAASLSAFHIVRQRPSSMQDQAGTWVVQMGYTRICSLVLCPETCSGDLFSFLCHVGPSHWHWPLGSRYIPLLLVVTLAKG